MKKNKHYFGKFFMILSLIFFYLPIVFVVLFSFNSSKSLTAFKGFSLKWYEKIFTSSNMMEALTTTVLVAIVATFVSTIVGTLAAVGLSKSKKIVRDLVLYINDFPIMNPEIVTAIGLMLFFVTLGIERGLGTMMLAHIAFCIPYVILSIMPKIRSLDPNLADAAMDLGASPWQALTKVIVPEIAPGIFSGALIAFTMSFDDFVISYFVTGRGVKNLSIMIYTMSKRVNPTINAVSTLIVAVITAGLIIVNIMPIVKEKSEAKRRKKAEEAGLDPDNLEPNNDDMKKLMAAAVIAVVGVIAIIFHGNGKGEFEGQVLHIYMPGEYLGETTISDFENATGAKVVVDEFDSNEQMYIKVANGDKYDLLIPSDYMVERLMQEERLQPLDQSKLKCWDDILTDCTNLAYDPGNVYSVPYMWGTVGICYDKTKVPLEDLEKDGFGIFNDPKYKNQLYLYDSERDEFMVALKYLGYSMNTDDPEELKEAYEWLLEVAENMGAEIVTDEIIDNMAQGRLPLGLMYSGDATYVLAENEDMGYFMPESGTNIWVDAMVIPENAENTELAYEFINYISSYDAAYGISEYVGYTSPNEEVFDEMSSEGGLFYGLDSYVPRSGNPKDEVFHYNEETRKIISEYWSKVKIAASNAK